MAEEHERESASLKADTESSLALAKAEHAAAVVAREQGMASLSAEHANMLALTEDTHTTMLRSERAKASDAVAVIDARLQQTIAEHGAASHGRGSHSHAGCSFSLVIIIHIK